MAASLSNIVSVSVEVSNPSLISSDFNLGLIIGNSGRLTSSNRLVVYSKDTYTTAMITDGFLSTDPEYLAAVEYFSQSPTPATLAVADIFTDTPNAAVVALRSLNTKWYNFCFAVKNPSTTLTSSVISSVAMAVEGFSIPTIFHFSTQEANCLVSGTTNILATLQTAKYTRTFGWFDSSTSQLTVPGIVGVVSGLNSMNANSAYTLAYKSVIGATVQDLTDSQLAILTSYNGNAYVKFGSSYQFTYPAISSGGYHADELYLIDSASYLIQQEAVAGLTSSRVIPQTDDGIAQLVTFISSACNTLFAMGIISSGIWNADPVASLNTGDAIENGYYIEAGKIADQSASDRLARKSPVIYVALKASGAVEHVVISVLVNR